MEEGAVNGHAANGRTTIFMAGSAAFAKLNPSNIGDVDTEPHLESSGEIRAEEGEGGIRESCKEGASARAGARNFLKEVDTSWEKFYGGET